MPSLVTESRPLPDQRLVSAHIFSYFFVFVSGQKRWLGRPGHRGRGGLHVWPRALRGDKKGVQINRAPSDPGTRRDMTSVGDRPMVRLVTDDDDLYSVTKSPAINILAMAAS